MNAPAPARRSSVPIPNARAHLYRVLANAIRPKAVLTVSAWADEHRILTSKSSGEPGRWRTARTPYLRTIMDDLSLHSPTQRVVMRFCSQIGKALALDTPIPTPYGWTTMEHLQQGDFVFDEQGAPCRVVFATDVMWERPCYTVTFSDGSYIVADADHLWAVEYEKSFNVGRPYHAGDSPPILTTEVISKHFKYQNRNRFAIPVAGSLQLPPASLPIDPYLLGVWLGDGSSYRAAIHVGGQDLEFFCTELRRIDDRFHVTQTRTAFELVYALKLVAPSGQCIRGHVLADVGKTKYGACAQCARGHANHYQRPHLHDKKPVLYSSVGSNLVNLGLINNKHIPPIYLRASQDQRLALLQGLMDTDGTCSGRGGRSSFCTTSDSLATGVTELARSLGLKPTVKKVRPTTRYKGKVVYGKHAYIIGFMAYRDIPVFRLPRKRALQVDRSTGRPTETDRRRIVNVEKTPSVPVKCIQVDSASHLYLAGRAMIPTHNTEVAMNWLGYIVDRAPSPVMIVLPTEKLRDKWVKQRLDPMLGETPVLRDLFGARRSRDSSNTKDIKEFPGGIMFLGGANSPAELSSVSAQYIICDEVDRFPWEAGNEGDPLGLIDERTKTFPRSKVLLVSTPTIAGLSRIDDEYQAGDQREYHVPCPHCGEYQVLRWTHPDGEPGLIHHKLTGAVYYRCLHCQERIDEHNKTAMLAAGQWRPRFPDRPVHSYTLSGLYSPVGLGFTWPELWAKWQEAHGDTARLKRFVNTTLGETWQELGDSVDPVGLISKLEDYPANIPANVRTIGVDVQKDRLELSVFDWGHGEEAWARDHIILPGDTALPHVWEDLGDTLSDLRPQAVGIDSGYNTQMVYAFVEKRPYCYAAKGIAGPGRPLVEDERQRRARLRQRRQRRAVVYPLGVDQGKALIYARLKLQGAGPGAIHFPRLACFDDEYFAQLAAEKLITKTRGTRAYAEWVQTRPRNEALDCAVYALAALRLSGIEPGQEMAQRPKIR